MRKLKQVKDTTETAAPEEAFGLLERLPVPMYVKSRDGRYLGVNKAWEELFGVSRASFVGKQVRELYPQNPEIADLHAARDNELWERPGAQTYPTTIITPDGRRRDTIYHKATYPSEGEAEGLVGAIFDVTARARAVTSKIAPTSPSAAPSPG